MQQYVLQELATAENFDEDAYLRANPNVVDCIRDGDFPSAQAHFEGIGKLQHRYLRHPASRVAAAKRAKLERIRPLLREDVPKVEREGCFDCLSEQLRAEFSICDTENVSDHPYDDTLIDLVKRHESGLVLDCGAGRRPVYYENVVNFEIVAYDTTDVLGVGEELPFKDHSFDAIISIAVLEHVKDPWRCAREIIRVLKPGGELICAVPFLQPVHGYPNHYYNMTAQGLRNLFEHSLCIDRTAVTDGTGPIHTLTWILRSWSEGLRGKTQEDFLNLQVRELTGHGALYMERAFVKELPEDKNFELASACFVFAHKPASEGAPVGDLPAGAPTAASSLLRAAPYDPLEVPAEEGPVLASMIHFQPVCQPLVEAWKPRSICEIGIENGRATQWLVALCGQLGCEYHGVDPSLESAPLPVAGASRATFHRQPSLEYLAQAPLHDVYFVDGDHNYFTVSRELLRIAELADGAERQPLVILHDVSWPWARRDLYYRFEDIPAEFRQESTTGGSLRLNRLEPVQPGGFQPAGPHRYALRPGGGRNGVLTAVEDFVSGHPGWEFLMLPSVFGLGILIPTASLDADRQAALQPVRAAVESLSPFLQGLEYNRIELITDLLEEKTRFALAAERARLLYDQLLQANSQKTSLQAELAVLRTQRDAIRAEREALAVDLHYKLSLAHAKAAGTMQELKAVKKQWKKAWRDGRELVKNASHHIRSLMGGLIPSRRRRQAAKAFIANLEKRKDAVATTKEPTSPPKLEAISGPPPSHSDILDYYESKAPSRQNVLDAFRGDWSTAMPADSGLVSAPGPAALFDDERLRWAAGELGGFKDLDILELGPLEGAHSCGLQKAGARKVTAVEANRRAFLKCLCTKEIFNLDRVAFLLGDFVAHLREVPKRYDLIVACGVLYHMTEPLELLDLIARHTDKLFLWTHYYDPVIIPGTPNLARRFGPLVEAEYHGFRFRAAEQSYQDQLNWSGFCGGSRPTSRWVARQSILDALAHFGFCKITVGCEQPAHPNGPAFAVCAQR